MNPIRRWILALFALGLAAGLCGPAGAAEAPKQLRIGYQKNGLLPLLKQWQSLEKRLGGEGIAVQWVEFPSGPPLLEAINVGSIDFGTTGDTPPIFAQAGGARIVYVA